MMGGFAPPKSRAWDRALSSRRELRYAIYSLSIIFQPSFFRLGRHESKVRWIPFKKGLKLGNVIPRCTKNPLSLSSGLKAKRPSQDFFISSEMRRPHYLPLFHLARVTDLVTLSWWQATSAPAQAPGTWEGGFVFRKETFIPRYWRREEHRCRTCQACSTLFPLIRPSSI